MSTTGGNVNGTILLLDPPATIRKKLMSAVTDSGSEVRHNPEKPGISNLVDVLAMLRGTTAKRIEKEFAGRGYGQFKGAVADAIIETLEPIQRRYSELRGAEDQLKATLDKAAQHAASTAAPTLMRMYEALGFVGRSVQPLYHPLR